MARRFNGSNTLNGTRNIFNEKKRYFARAGVNQVSNNPGLFRNFWFIENMYYGKMDRGHNFLTVKRSKLKTVSDKVGNTIVLVDFVADALAGFLREHDKALSTGKIRKNDDILSDLSFVKGHNNILLEYDLHMESISRPIHRYMLRNHSKIENFNDFVNLFVERVIHSRDKMPVTLTGFVSSRHSSLSTTGLFTEVSSLKYDKDTDKVDQLFDKPNFKFFMKNCLEYGFMIDYNVPWRICANIGSVEMERYMIKRGTTPENFFSDYYEPAYLKNMNYFLEYMLKYYNRFVTIKPNIKREARTGGLNSTTHRYVEKRPRIKKEQMYQEFGHDYRLKLYIDLRNYETGYRYNVPLIKRLKDNCLEYLYADQKAGLAAEEESLAAYAYVEHQFKGFLSDMGGYNAYMMKQEAKKEKSETTGQEIETLLKDSVVESRRTLY